MFGVLVFFGGVNIGVVFRAAVATGDNDAFIGDGLDMIEQFRECRVDKFVAISEG